MESLHDSTLGGCRAAGHPSNLGFYADIVTYQRAQQRIVRICEAARDSRALRIEVVAELRRVVDFDAYVWMLTDPETSVGAVPLADVPPALLADLPRLIGLKYLTTLNRWTGLSAKASRLTDPAGSRLWSELLHAHGVTDLASMALRDRYGCWGFLDLWRIGGSFTDAELAFLESLAPAATTALRRCQAETFNGSAMPVPRPGPVVLLLSPTLEVESQTPEVHKYLRVLVPPAAGNPPIPASAYNVAAQVLANEEGVDDNPPWARVHLVDGRWLSLRAGRLGSTGQIAVTIEEASTAERLGVFSRAFGLSDRESELMTQLTSGADTRGLAARMYLSENTVQDYFKSIFSKTTTRSRGTLLSRALGGAAD
jgi:DNA-binding CsgD family transcriptional regulator